MKLQIYYEKHWEIIKFHYKLQLTAADSFNSYVQNKKYVASKITM